MWDLINSTSLRDINLRRLTAYLSAAFAVALLCIVSVSNIAFAAAGATWNGNTILYSGNTYSAATSDIATGLNLPKDSQTYDYIGQQASSVPKSVESGSPTTPTTQNSTLYVIYFPGGADLTTTKTAKYETATYTYDSKIQNPSQPIDISVDPAGKTQKTTACATTITPGISWIICPITNSLATGMDWIYKAVSSFLTVRPITTDTNSALFRAWSYMRNFANIAFVIGFLIIIYSQLTNFGISNYGVKKLLPRLIIAALLVNLSYFICAIGVDISNVLGSSIEQLFLSIRNGLMAGGSTPNWDLMNWSNVTGFVLSGGTAAVAGITGVVALSAYDAAGIIFLLLPALIGALFSALLALLIMAARQALITILVIISPLAFVAYLLPNTEKWFTKWRETLMTMLIIFPAFAVVFGGAQLASAAIIQNANSLNIIILGLLVQVAPLMITPLLLKLSGSMMQQLANFARKPGDWINGQAKSYFRDDLAATRRSRNMARDTHQSFFNPLHQAQQFDRNKRDRKHERDVNEAVTDTKWKERSRRWRQNDLRSREFADRKSLVEGQSEFSYNSQKNVPGRLQALDTQLRSVTDQNTAAKSATEAEYEVRKTKAYQNDNNAEWRRQSSDMRQALTQGRVSAEAVAINGMRKNSAQGIQQTELGESLDRDIYLRNVAGGNVAGGNSTIDLTYAIDPNGATKAQAAAINVIAKAGADSTASINAILDRSNLSDVQLLSLATGQGTVTDDEGRVIAADPAITETVIGRIAEKSGVDTVQKLAEQMDLTSTNAANRDLRLAFTNGLMKNSNKPKFMGMGWIAQMSQGAANGLGQPLANSQSVLDLAIINAINGGKMDTDTLLAQDKDALKRMLDVLDRQDNNALDPMLVDDQGAPVRIERDALLKLEGAIAQTQGMFYQGRGGELKKNLGLLHEKMVNDMGIPASPPPPDPFGPNNPNPQNPGNPGNPGAGGPNPVP